MTCPKCFEADTTVSVADDGAHVVKCTSDECDFRHVEDAQEAAEKRREQQAERERVDREMEGHLAGLRQYLARRWGDDR